MVPIRSVLDPAIDELPHPLMLCKAMDRLTTALYRRLLKRTPTLQELGDITAIDASSFDRIAASRRYARRTDYRFMAMKTTLLVDCQSSTIHNLHCSTSCPHETKTG